MFRKAQKKDICEIVKIYNAIHDNEEQGRVTIGWKRGIYPTEQTALDALEKEILFVYEDNGKIVAAAKIDQSQVPEYANATWEYEAPDNQVMVLHTLVVDPNYPHRGYGKKFVAFYEKYALENHCHYLRMDTNEKNIIARKMYKSLGYKEIGIVPCVFNGISNVQLVCLEKCIDYNLQD